MVELMILERYHLAPQGELFVPADEQEHGLIRCAQFLETCDAGGPVAMKNLEQIGAAECVWTKIAQACRDAGQAQRVIDSECECEQSIEQLKNGLTHSLSPLKL